MTFRMALPLSLALLISHVWGDETPEAGQTLAPFFFVKTDDPGLDQLPLKSVSASVRIAGVIADVVIRQEYANEGGKPLEATYVFPASTQAAVYGMEMTIGDRVITAEIREREEAREEYEEAIEAGYTASLLEQQRPNVFQMTVGNILPGDRILVELRYTETLVPTEGEYEFVYPTVVGPRYSEIPLGEVDPKDLFVASPYTHEGEPATYGLDIDVELSTGVPIQAVSSISHDIEVSYPEPGRARVELSDPGGTGGNRDYILRYRLAGDKIESGLLLYEGEDENFFLFMGQPPERVEEEEIPPREYIFVVDVSGSMSDYPIEVSKAAARSDRAASPHRSLQRAALRPRLQRALRGIPPCLKGERGAGSRSHPDPASRGRNPARGGPPAGHAASETEREYLPLHRDRHRWLHLGRGRGLRPDPGEPR